MTFKNLRLSSRLALVQALTVIVTAVACSGLIFSRLNRALIDASATALDHSIEVRGTHFSARIDEMIHDVLLMATVPPIQGLIRTHGNGGVDPLDGSTSALWRERLETIYSSVIRHKPDYLQVRFIGIADGGRELIRVERSMRGGELRALHGETLQHKGRRIYFQRTIAQPPGGVFISPINLNREHDAIEVPYVPVIRVGTPVYGADGKLFGAVVINLAIENLLAELADAQDSSLRYYVTNEQGQYLHHPDPDRNFAFELGDTPSARQEFEGLDAIIDGATGQIGLVNDTAQRVTVARRIDYGLPGGGTGLLVIASDSFADATAIAERVLEQVFALILILGGAAAALGLWLSQRIARPIEHLAHAVRTMDLEQAQLRVPEGLTAEARELSHALTDSLAALRHRSEELESRNTEIERFAYMASHDLQAPLRHIKFFVTVISEDFGDTLPDGARDSLGKLKDAVGRLHDRIDALLRFSRVQRARPDIAPLDLNRTLEQVVSDLNVDIADAEAQVIWENLPTVAADRVLLPLVLQNLIENALRYRGESPPVIRISGSTTNATATVRVRDNGRGFDPKYREQIFRAFERLEHDSRGTGIGLAICQLIMDKHQGTITAEGQPGQGATFTLSWTQAAAPGAAEHRAQS